MTDADTEILQGTLDLLILKTLSLGPMHGYGVLLRIQQSSNDVLRIRQGSLYPALYRLESQHMLEYEWGTSESGRRAKYYRLTRAGRKKLEKEAASWERLSAAIVRILQTA